MKRQAVVVDLDGTLLSVNSFREYVLYVVKESLRTGRVGVLLPVMWNVVLRILRVMPHSVMKCRVLEKSSLFMDAARLSRFVDKLLLQVNADVEAMCEKYRSRGYYILLATAAPVSYSEIISCRMGFDGCCATPLPLPELKWHENARNHKRESVLQHLSSMNASVAVVITDHHDDIPLMKTNSGENILINPSQKTLSFVRKSGIPIAIL